MKKNNQNKFTLSEARTVAEKILEELKPHCESVEIVGSIRRNKEEVSDIDLIIIPKRYESGLFSTGVAIVLDKFEKVKGDLVYGQTRNAVRIISSGIKLDCYFCEPENYGLIKAIRTGSENFNRTLLIPSINSAGYKCKDGYLTFEDEVIKVKNEKELFKLIGLGYTDPEKRD